MQSTQQAQPQSDDGVAVTLLGGFAARRSGVAVAESVWRLRKGRELVKLLALAPGHQLHRGQLMDALWPELDGAAAANNLNQVVHVARKALGNETIALREEVLKLIAAVDVEDFERAAEQARRSGSTGAYRAALAMYGGEMLPENRYDDWARTRREEIEDLRAELEAELADLDDDRMAALPVQASSFVGRAHELGELLALVERTRLLTLAGPGGAGKTRLALELAQAAQARRDDGAAFVELAHTSDAAGIPTAVATALDVSALPGRSHTDGLAEFLSPRSFLLVLDNCEHVLLAAAQLADALLRAAPGLMIVTTSREPLRLPGEVVFRVPSMTIPNPEQPMEPEQLLRYESVQLLVARAVAASPDFELDAENAADIARICFRLDGLPLALELAAARLGALGTAVLADRIEDSFRVLREGNRVGPTRQQTLAATLEWSHALLGTEEKVLLRRLAAFPGGFDLDAAEQVCSGDGLDASAIADVLARLVEKSLVNAERHGRNRRYHLLELVRLYALERQAEAGEQAALADRQAAWALATAEREGGSPGLDREAANLRAAHGTLIESDPARELRYCVALLPFWMRRIDLGEGHRRLQEALDAAPARTPLRAAALLTMSALDFRSGALACGDGHASESYEIAVESGDARAQWAALQRLGEVRISFDDAEGALVQLGRARELARSEGLVACEAVSVYSRGVARWLLGDLAGADEMLAESGTAFRSLAGTAERVISPVNIAELLSGAGTGRPGVKIVFEETLLPFVEISCATAVGYVLANQATIARVRGERGRARELLEEARGRFARENDARGEADVLVRFAYLELAENAPNAARAHLDTSLRLRRAMRDRRGVGMALLALGLVETVGGALEQAEAPLAEARALFRRAGDRWGLVSSLWRTADLAIARGLLEEADAILREARSVVEETERERWIAVTIGALAEVKALRGEPDAALALFDQAQEHHGRSGLQEGMSELAERAQILADERQSERKATPRRNARKATSKRRHT